jgi:thiol-disulfide isomerase/thioredoxin
MGVVKQFTLLLVLALLASMSVLVSTATEEAEEQEVQIEVPLLDADELYTVLDAHDRVLVLWTTERVGCSQCRTAAKIVDALANKEEMQTEQIHVVKFDCDSDKDTCKSHQVTTYPHFTFFLDGFGVYEHPGATQSPTLLGWINRCV